MFSFEGTNVKLVSHENLDEAVSAATKFAGSTGGYASPCVLFRQGKRTMVAAAIPFKIVIDKLISKSAPEKGTVEQVRDAKNRPEASDHSESIANYISENVNGKFILPPLTLNVSETLFVHAQGYKKGEEPPTKNGMLILPMSAKIDITDGQHRRSGITRAYERLDRETQILLDTSSVAVMITMEADNAQVHQDFADCSKTKPLPPSQLAVYDRRNPANAMVMDIIEMVPLFTGKVDSTSAKLSKKSPAPFLANQVRQVVKVFMTGAYGASEIEFEDKVKKNLKSGNSAEYTATRDTLIAFLQEAIAEISVLKEISAMPVDLMKTRIPAMREEGWVAMSATGINMIARVAYLMMRDNEPNWKEYARKLGKIDWRRTAEIWRGNVVSDDGSRILTAHKAFRMGVEAILKEIGWTPKVYDLEPPDEVESEEPVEAAA